MDPDSILKTYLDSILNSVFFYKEAPNYKEYWHIVGYHFDRNNENVIKILTESISYIKGEKKSNSNIVNLKTETRLEKYIATLLLIDYFNRLKRVYIDLIEFKTLASKIKNIKNEQSFIYLFGREEE